MAQTISIPKNEVHGHWRVAADIVGPFAIHLPQGSDATDNFDLVITHLFSGLKICRVPGDEAYEVARQLDEAADWYDIGWMDLGDPQQTKLREIATAVKPLRERYGF